MRAKIVFLLSIYALNLFGNTSSTIISRLQLSHPDLGYDGGAGLHTQVANLYTKIGDNINSRYSEYSSVANSTTTTVEHNLGAAFTEYRILLYTGTGSSKTRILNPTTIGTPWTIAATSGFTTTKVDITTPASGGPFTFSVEIVQLSTDLVDVRDVDLSTAPQDGQALVYNSGSSKWAPGASGDASLKCQAVSTPNLTLKSGYLILGDGTEIQLATDLSLNLTTVLGSSPANATAYYLYLDRDALPSASTLTNGRVVKVASTTSHFSLQTATPDTILLSRYIPLCVIKSATTGTAWSGTGSAFATLATRRHDRPLLNVSPTVYSLTQQAVGSLGSSGQIVAGHVLTSASFPTFTTQVSFYNLSASGADGSGNSLTLTNNATIPFTGTNILGSTNSAAALTGASSQYFSSTNAFFNPGGADFSSGAWFAATDWTPAALMAMIGNIPATTDRGWVIYVNTDGSIGMDYNTSSSTVSTITVSNPGFVDGSWHHFAVRYINSAKTWIIYIDGQQAGSANSSVANRSLTSTRFAIGAALAGPSQFYTGKVEDAFFTTLSLKEEDIRRLYAYKATHSKNVAVANQQWDASFVGNLSNKLGNSWLVHMDANSVWWDFSDLASTDQVQPTMANKSFTTTNVPIYTFTTGKLTAAPTFPLAHGLGARPKDFYILTTASSIALSDDKRYDLCSATDTSITCDLSSLTIDSTHFIEIIASAVPIAIAVPSASATASGIVDQATQTFAGSKTLTQTDVNGGQVAGFRNRIINGDMRIDQRFLGTLKTLATNVEYVIDRWNHTYSAVTGGRTITVQQVTTTPPVGFIYYNHIVHTSTGTAAATTETITVQQIIEGTSVDDLDWGKSTAKNMVLSFWVRHSSTGTFGGAIGNGTGVGRAYPFTYTVIAANTWEYKQVQIVADVAGVASTWVTDNRPGLSIRWGLCQGSTFQGTAFTWVSTDLYNATGASQMCTTTGSSMDLTGVQFEIGTQATPFERRPYGTEINLARRYYYKPDYLSTDLFKQFGVGAATTTTNAIIHVPFPVMMRISPSLTTSTISLLGASQGNTVVALTSAAINNTGFDAVSLALAVSAGFTVGNAVLIGRNNSASGFIAFSSEL